MDINKTQKDNEMIQKETQLQLETVDAQLDAIKQSQQKTEKQLQELIKLLHTSNSQKTIIHYFTS